MINSVWQRKLFWFENWYLNAMVPYLNKASKCSTSTCTPMHVPPPSPSRSVISIDSGGFCVKLHKQIVLLCSMAEYWQKPSKMLTSSSNECSMPWEWGVMNDQKYFPPVTYKIWEILLLCVPVAGCATDWIFTLCNYYLFCITQTAHLARGYKKNNWVWVWLPGLTRTI